MIKVAAIQDHVVSMLKNGLPASFTYHNLAHTLDVTMQCKRIAAGEGITDKETLLELEIAALYHDTGFLHIYLNHEEKSCELAIEQLPGFGVNKKMIENICAIIMATKVPQSPHNHLQQIICDADLDYLGRDDFFIVGENLRKELAAYKIINSTGEWEERQLAFLQSHNYFTKTSQQQRTPAKLQHLQKLLDNKNKNG